MPNITPKRQFIERISYWRTWGPEPRKWWQPHYDLTLSDGKVVSVEVDVSSVECPKSVVLRHPQATELIQIVEQAQQVRGALGPPSQWPGSFYDAVTFIKVQQRINEAAIEDAIKRS